TGAGRVVVQVDQRLVLRQDQRIDPPVVVEVAGGQAPAQVQGSEGGAGLRRDVGQRAVGAPQQELRRHGEGEVGAAVGDVAVGGQDVEPAVVVDVEQRDPEAEEGAA